MPDQIPPKKIDSSEELVKPAPVPAEDKTEETKKVAFTEKLEEKEVVKPKSSFHAAFGKMLGSEATGEQIDRFVNTWVQDQLREMRKAEQKLHKSWREMRP